MRRTLLKCYLELPEFCTLIFIAAGTCNLYLLILLYNYMCGGKVGFMLGFGGELGREKQHGKGRRGTENGLASSRDKGSQYRGFYILPYSFLYCLHFTQVLNLNLF